MPLPSKQRLFVILVVLSVLVCTSIVPLDSSATDRAPIPLPALRDITRGQAVDEDTRRALLLQREFQGGMKRRERRFLSVPKSAVRPIMPPGLTSEEAIRARRVRDYVCPNVPDQTLSSPSGPRQSLRIITAGMGRSGSTWQFNAVVAILKELLSEYATLGLTLGCPFSVIKVHQLHPHLLSLADFVFTSHRDPRDSYSSLVQLGARFLFGHYWGEYLRWSQFACLDMAYEDFYLNQTREVERLLDALSVDRRAVNVTRVLMRVKAAQRDAEEANLKISHNREWHVLSGFFKEHVTDPEPGRWRKLLTSNYTSEGPSLMFVESVTRDWMMKNGYKLYFTTESRTHNLTLPMRAPFEMSAHTLVPTTRTQHCPLSASSSKLGARLPAATDFPRKTARLQR